MAFRKAERVHMIEALKELIEESRRRVKSHSTPAKDRTRWVKLAGQLIWYKDQILRSLSYEELEEEVSKLKERVFKKDETPGPPGPSQVIPRRTVLKGVALKRTRRLPLARQDKRTRRNRREEPDISPEALGKPRFSPISKKSKPNRNSRLPPRLS